MAALPSSINRPQSIVSAAVVGYVPQDTTVTLSPKPPRRVATLAARLLALPVEPEDAKLTGSTRSLHRRLVGLNLPGSLNRPRSERSSIRLLPQSTAA